MRGITNVPEKADGVNAHAATHYAGGGDPLDLSKLGAIPTSEKGKAGGTATLGEDGKVPSGQLPEMNYAAANHGHTFENITGVLPVEKGGTGVNSLDTLAAALGASKVVTGTYTGVAPGTSTASKTISLGFTPTAVFVWMVKGSVDYGQSPNGMAQALQNAPATYLSIVDGGFKVSGGGANSVTKSLNYENTPYAYIAIA